MKFAGELIYVGVAWFALSAVVIFSAGVVLRIFCVGHLKCWHQHSMKPITFYQADCSKSDGEVVFGGKFKLVCIQPGCTHAILLSATITEHRDGTVTACYRHKNKVVGTTKFMITQRETNDDDN